MEHLSLEIFDIEGISSQYAMMEEDESITIIDTSDIFASGDVWSYSFRLNIRANAHIFGTSGEIHGSRLHEQINKRRARLWVEGLPLYLGYLKMENEVTVDEDGYVDVTFESGKKTFSEMTEGAKANQVPMMGDVKFGMALWRKRWSSFSMKLNAVVKFLDGHSDRTTVYQFANNVEGYVDYVKFETDGEDTESAIQLYPRMVFSKGSFKKITDNEGGGGFGGSATEQTDNYESINYLNTDYPYDMAHPYCNVALCYQKYGYEKKNDKGETVVDYSSEPEAERGYEVMPANRVNSAPNFYVIYWIEALMKHLGIYIEENQMMDVEDLRRLFFVNTNCAYNIPDNLRTAQSDSPYDKYIRRRGGFGKKYDYVPERVSKQPVVKIEESGFTCNDIQGNPVIDRDIFTEDEKTIDKITIEVDEVKNWDGTDGRVASTLTEYLNNNSYFHEAFASSECFPNVEISEVINAIEHGFGIRFLFNDNYQRVRIVLLRNIFRSEEVQHLECDVISTAKRENSIRGFRMTYGKGSEDTHFYYKGFADKLEHQKELWPDNSDTHNYSQWSLNERYSNLIHKVSAFDKTCYVTPDTGNAYGIKVDKDAKRIDELYPSLFEYAGFMDAEDGDCTGEEETIETINVGFTPAIMNDLNMENERQNGDDGEQRFALFVDEKMKPRRPNLQEGVDYNDSDADYDVNGKLYAKTDNRNYDFERMMSDGVVKPGEFCITSDMSASVSDLKATVSRLKVDPSEVSVATARWNLTIGLEGHINEGYRLYLQDNYEPNDDGVSPVETHDWGLTLGIMRGSGSDAYVDYRSDMDDGEGNDTWERISGSSVTAHPDTCDNYGNLWDYDGSEVVSGGGTAIEQMQRLWPDSNIDLIYSSGRTQRDVNTYINSAATYSATDNNGSKTTLLFATTLGANGQTSLYTGKIQDYGKKFKGMTRAQMKAFDNGSEGFGILIETDSSAERKNTLLALQRRAFVYGDTSSDAPIYIDNGVGSLFGRFSLKLRAEKPNPFFDSTQPESSLNRRYLEISNPNLRCRGLSDQFYREYSYFVRNARIVVMTVRMELAQLLAINKTMRVEVGDVMGFIRKIQYSVSKKTGLGNVTMEILYI